MLSYGRHGEVSCSVAVRDFRLLSDRLGHLERYLTA